MVARPQAQEICVSQEDVDEAAAMGFTSDEIAEALNEFDVKIVPTEGLGNVSAVVCTFDEPPYYFADDVKGPCSNCGAALKWRPNAPNVRKLCVPCGHKLSGQ